MEQCCTIASSTSRAILLGNDDQKKVVRDGFNVWKNLGIGIKFEEVSNPGDAQIRIGFLRGGGTWSAVGRDLFSVWAE